jgi:hypothetical protein
MFLFHEAYIASISPESTSTADYTYALRPCILTTVSSTATATLNLLSTENYFENLWNHLLTLSLEALVTQYLSETSLRLKPTT